MIDTAAITRGLDELEHIQRDLAAIAVRTDDARRLELVQLRRSLSSQVTLIGKLAEPICKSVPGDHADFRRLFSVMRSAAALHQAQWPAVRLGDDLADYQRSAKVVRAANVAFATWLRAALTNFARR